jgi:hypothetical protein
MFSDTVDFVQDSTYPLACPSGKAPGHGQLHNAFRRLDATGQKHQKNKHQEDARYFFHNLSTWNHCLVAIRFFNYAKSPQVATAIYN